MYDSSGRYFILLLLFFFVYFIRISVSKVAERGEPKESLVLSRLETFHFSGSSVNPAVAEGIISLPLVTTGAEIRVSMPAGTDGRTDRQTDQPQLSTQPPRRTRLHPNRTRLWPLPTCSSLYIYLQLCVSAHSWTSRYLRFCTPPPNRFKK